MASAAGTPSMCDMALQPNPIFLPDDRVASQLANWVRSPILSGCKCQPEINIDAVPSIKTGWLTVSHCYCESSGNQKKPSPTSIQSPKPQKRE